MYGSKQVSLKSQRGVSLTGLMVVLGIILAVGMLALKVIPGMLEYKSIKDGITFAKAQTGTAVEMRQAFDRHADINSITTIKGKDLMINKVNGETEVAFDYEQKIALFKNVTLLINYAGTTDKSGIVPDKAETPIQ